MPATMRDKALTAIAEDRVRVVKASAQGIALHVTASKPDANLTTPTYRTFVYVHEGEVRRMCSCPAPKNCYHLTAAELLWRPGSAT